MTFSVLAPSDLLSLAQKAYRICEYWLDASEDYYVFCRGSKILELNRVTSYSGWGTHNRIGDLESLLPKGHKYCLCPGQSEATNIGSECCRARESLSQTKRKRSITRSMLLFLQSRTLQCNGALLIPAKHHPLDCRDCKPAQPCLSVIKSCLPLR
jgi:hypothetical protein